MYKVNEKNIFDIWNMTIDDAVEFFNGLDAKIIDQLQEASSLLLGHLRIGQPVSTLSGGENIRVKLLKAMKSTTKVFGVDEPFKGLSSTEIYCVVKYLNRLRSKNKTIIVVDHSDMIEQYFAKHIKLTCDNGILRDVSSQGLPLSGMLE